MVKLESEVEELFEKILDYSLNLVVTFTTNRDNAVRIAAYADYFSIPDEDVLQQIGLDQQDWESFVADVRSQTKFLKAVETAQVILNGSAWYMNTILDDLVERYDLEVNATFKFKRKKDDKSSDS